MENPMDWGDWRSAESNMTAAAAAAKSLLSCLTLCDPIDGSPSGSAIPGILHARTLEWVAISFSNAWKWKVKVKSLSPVQPFATPWTASFFFFFPWTASYQAPLSMGFSRKEYWSGLPLPSLQTWLKWLNTHGFVWTPGVGDGQGGLAAAVHGVAKIRTRLSDWTELNINYVKLVDNVTQVMYIFTNFCPCIVWDT